MNPDLSKLQPYPFEKLAKLKAGITPPAGLEHIALSIGEPKHATPELIRSRLVESLNTLDQYPLTKGGDDLRSAIRDWLIQRFKLDADSLDINQHILPVNGTREALFAFAQCVVDRNHNPYVMMPNPFYQIYEGAALLAGALPYFMNTEAQNHFIPDFNLPAADWKRCQMIYLCSPGNPTGAVVNQKQLQELMDLAERYDFIIASDECYSEIYLDEKNPPVGLLEAAQVMGNTEYKRCVVFHSLSKRSNAPGLRSGFVAGDAAIIDRFRLYRTYHGCAMSPPFQQASIAAWSDEKHVLENRKLYQQKFNAVIPLLNETLEVDKPEAGFYLWLKTPVNDEDFARELFARQNLTVLPGSYLSRDHDGHNPGENRVRLALVPTLENCIEAANRINKVSRSLK
jgi:N-succinyldiaminopimelate aminotransferase